MADPGLEDLGARPVAIAQALTSGRIPDTDELRNLLPTQVVDRVADTRAVIEAAANGFKQRRARSCLSR